MTCEATEQDGCNRMEEAVRRSWNAVGVFNEIKQIGKGGFGVVVAAKEKRPGGGEYAIKKVDINKTGLSYEDITREADIMKHLRHLNIVEVYASFVEAGQFHIVMQYCKGGNLKQAIVNKKLNGDCFEQDRICIWLAEVSVGLTWLHYRNIIHRDLKPENIFLMDDSRQTIKLGDFGIAKQFEYTGQYTNRSIGTLSHMAPEVMSGQKYAFPADVWALGVVAYELATLELPALITQSYAPIANANYNAEFRDLIEKKMLVPNAANRANLTEINNHPALRHYVKRAEAKADDFRWQIVAKQTQEQIKLKTGQEFKKAIDYASKLNNLAASKATILGLLQKVAELEDHLSSLENKVSEIELNRQQSLFSINNVKDFFNDIARHCRESSNKGLIIKFFLRLLYIFMKLCWAFASAEGICALISTIYSALFIKYSLDIVMLFEWNKFFFIVVIPLILIPLFEKWYFSHLNWSLLPMEMFRLLSSGFVCYCLTSVVFRHSPR